MAIFLTESDINGLASMDMAIDAVERAFRLQGEEKAHIAPRRRCRMEKGMLHLMSASLPALGYAGLKSYTSVAGANRFVVLLYEGDGRLAAVMEADRLGQLRTGAASAVATRFMAREDASRLGVFGAGGQARAQIEAIRTVRPITQVTVYSRTADRLKEFCRETAEATGIGIVPAGSPEAAVREQDIVVTATTSAEPVFKGEWLAAGTHINAVGSNFLTRREIDGETVRRSACVIVDSLEQARMECGDLALAAGEEAFYWEDARELGLVVVGEFPGREDAAEITLFESQGVALEDVALAAEIYKRALEAGTGEKLPF